jgi:hypothetical protein
MHTLPTFIENDVADKLIFFHNAVFHSYQNLGEAWGTRRIHTDCWNPNVLARNDAARGWISRMTHAGNAGLSDYLLAGKRPPPLRKRRDDSSGSGDVSISDTSLMSMQSHEASQDASLSADANGSFESLDPQVEAQNMPDSVKAPSGEASLRRSTPTNKAPSPVKNGSGDSGPAGRSADDTAGGQSQDRAQQGSPERMVLPTLADSAPSGHAHAPTRGNGTIPKHAAPLRLPNAASPRKSIQNSHALTRESGHAQAILAHAPKPSRRPPSPPVPASSQPSGTLASSPPGAASTDVKHAYGPSPRRARVKRADQCREGEDAPWHGQSVAGEERGEPYVVRHGYGEGARGHKDMSSEDVRGEATDEDARDRLDDSSLSYDGDLERNNASFQQDADDECHTSGDYKAARELPEHLGTTSQECSFDRGSGPPTSPWLARHVSYKTRRPANVDVTTPPPGRNLVSVYVYRVSFGCMHLFFCVTYMRNIISHTCRMFTRRSTHINAVVPICVLGSTQWQPTCSLDCCMQQSICALHASVHVHACHHGYARTKHVHEY